jgi:hypothetical protein
MKRLLATVASIGLLAATPSFAGEYDAYKTRFILLAGQIWNGTSSTFVAPFFDKTSCEKAFADYKLDGEQKIMALRPGQGFRPVFWHVCSAMNTAMPS